MVQSNSFCFAFLRQVRYYHTERSKTSELVGFLRNNCSVCCIFKIASQLYATLGVNVSAATYCHMTEFSSVSESFAPFKMEILSEVCDALTLAPSTLNVTDMINMSAYFLYCCTSCETSLMIMIFTSSTHFTTQFNVSFSLFLKLPSS